MVKKLNKTMLMKPLNEGCKCALMADAIQRGSGISSKKLKQLMKKAVVRVADLAKEHQDILAKGVSSVVKGERDPKEVLEVMAKPVAKKFIEKMSGQGYKCGAGMMKGDGFSTNVGIELNAQSGGSIFGDALGTLGLVGDAIVPGLGQAARYGAWGKKALGLGHGGAVRPAGGSVHVAGEGHGGSVRPAGGSVNVSGGAVNPAGGSIFGDIAGFMLGGPAGVAGAKMLGIGKMDYAKMFKTLKPAIGEAMNFIFSRDKKKPEPKTKSARQRLIDEEEEEHDDGYKYFKKSSNPIKAGCKRRLKTIGITSKKSWREWALRNHPDKGGNPQEFAVISDCVDKLVKGKGMHGSGVLEKLNKKLAKAEKALKIARTGVDMAKKFPPTSKMAKDAEPYLAKAEKIHVKLKKGSKMAGKARKTVKKYTGLGEEGGAVRPAGEGMDGGFLGMDWLPSPSKVVDLASPLLSKTPLAPGVSIAKNLTKSLGIGKSGGSVKVAGGGRKPNPWIKHLKEFRAKNPGMSYKVAMQKAKLSYKK